MIYAIYLAYTQPTDPDRHHWSIPKLHQIGSLADYKLLESLDKCMKLQNLKNCSGGELRSLCLMIIGKILAIGYTDPGNSSTTPKNGAQVKAKQSFLCQILAHYAIYLGSQLKLPMASGSHQFSLEAALARGDKESLF